MSERAFPDSELATMDPWCVYIATIDGRDIYDCEVTLAVGNELKHEIRIVSGFHWKGYTLGHIEGHARRSKDDFWRALLAALKLTGFKP